MNDRSFLTSDLMPPPLGNGRTTAGVPHGFLMAAIFALPAVILFPLSSVAWQSPSTNKTADDSIFQRVPVTLAASRSESCLLDADRTQDSAVSHLDETFLVPSGEEQIEVFVSSDPDKIAQQIQKWEQVRTAIEASVRCAIDGDASEIHSFTAPFVRRFRPTELQQDLQAILAEETTDIQQKMRAAQWLLHYHDPQAITWIVERFIEETAFEPRVALLSMLAKYTREAHHLKTVSQTGLPIPKSEKLFPAVLQTIRESNLVPHRDTSQEQQVMIGTIANPVVLDSSVTASDIPAMLDYLRQRPSVGRHDTNMLLWLVQRYPSEEGLAIARQFAQVRPATNDSVIQDTILALIRSDDQAMARQAMDLYCELGDFQVTIQQGYIDSRGRDPSEFEKRSDPISLDVWFHRARLIVHAMSQGVELPSEMVDPVQEEFLRRMRLLMVDVADKPDKHARLFSDWSSGVPLPFYGPTEPALQPIDPNHVAWLFRKTDNATVIEFLDQSDQPTNQAAMQRVMKHPLELSATQRQRRHETLKEITSSLRKMPAWRWISTDAPLDELLLLFQENGIGNELSKKELLKALKSHQANDPNRLDWFPLPSLEHEVNSYDAIITLFELEHRVKLAYGEQMFGKFDDHFWLMVDISRGEFDPHAFTVKGQGTPQENSQLSFVYRDKLYSMPYSIHADPGAPYLLPIFNAILEREGIASRFHMTTGYRPLRSWFTSGVFVFCAPGQLFAQLEDRFAEDKD